MSTTTQSTPIQQTTTTTNITPTNATSSSAQLTASSPKSTRLYYNQENINPAIITSHSTTPKQHKQQQMFDFAPISTSNSQTGMPGVVEDSSSSSSSNEKENASPRVTLRVLLNQSAAPQAYCQVEVNQPQQGQDESSASALADLLIQQTSELLAKELQEQHFSDPVIELPTEYSSYGEGVSAPEEEVNNEKRECLVRDDSNTCQDDQSDLTNIEKEQEMVNGDLFKSAVDALLQSAIAELNSEMPEKQEFFTQEKRTEEDECDNLDDAEEQEVAKQQNQENEQDQASGDACIESEEQGDEVEEEEEEEEDEDEDTSANQEDNDNYIYNNNDGAESQEEVEGTVPGADQGENSEDSYNVSQRTIQQYQEKEQYSQDRLQQYGPLSTDNDSQESTMGQGAITLRNVGRYYRLDQLFKTIVLEDFLEIPEDTKFDFGDVLPGNIMEENLEIRNKSSEYLLVKITVLCHNPDLAALDEYVYSVRKLPGYDYNERQFSLIPPFGAVKLKIALKVPNVKQNIKVIGSVAVELRGFDNAMLFPVSCQAVTPKIVCPKELYNVHHQFSLIKLAMKRGRRQECKIPFKNNTSSSIALEFEFLKESTSSFGNASRGNSVINKILASQFEVNLYPSGTIVPANGMFIVTIQVKNQQLGSYLSAKQLEASSKEYQSNEVKKVLLMKVKNSTVVLSFPICIEFYKENQQGESNLNSI